MFTADQIFAHLVYLALPATFLYPLIYGLTSPWWKTWIGRALMVEALGVFTLMVFSALFYYFGPDYYGRDSIRIGGMIFACLGFYMVLIALIKVKLEMRRKERESPHPLRRSTDLEDLR